jgi:hypothetical protein
MEKKNFWCIVTYIGATPYYYCGYYKKRTHVDENLKPVLSCDFNDAMKLHNESEAKRILSLMNIGSDYKVEEHAFF